MTRVASRLWSYSPKVRLAADICFMLPGAPFVFYAEELGFQNDGVDGNWPKRKPMQWNDNLGFGFPKEAVTQWQPFQGSAEIYSVVAQDGMPDIMLHHLVNFVKSKLICTLKTYGLRHDAATVVTQKQF